MIYRMGTYAQRNNGSVPNIIIPGDVGTPFTNVSNMSTGVGTCTGIGSNAWGNKYCQMTSINSGQDFELKFKYITATGNVAIGITSLGGVPISWTDLNQHIHEVTTKDIRRYQQPGNILLYHRIQAISTTFFYELHRVSGAYLFYENGVLLHTLTSGYNGAGNIATSIYQATGIKEISITKY